jgi:hypothetical protein
MKLMFDVTVRHPWGSLATVKVRHWDAVSAGRYVADLHPHSEIVNTMHVRYSF